MGGGREGRSWKCVEEGEMRKERGMAKLYECGNGEGGEEKGRN